MNRKQNWHKGERILTVFALSLGNSQRAGERSKAQSPVGQTVQGEARVSQLYGTGLVATVLAVRFSKRKWAMVNLRNATTK